MFHRVQIINEGSIRTKVRLDNKKIRCFGYTISQSVGEIPKIELEMHCSPEMTFKKAKIEISDGFVDKPWSYVNVRSGDKAR